MSDRYFSLRDVTTNLEENRIVTGISINKKNRIIQLIIAETELLPYGRVNTNSKMDDDNSKPYNRFKTNEEFKITDAGIQNGLDYHTLTWENRGINLDTVIAPKNKIVTGVRFSLDAQKRLTLQIRVTDFNFETGNKI